MAPTDEEPGKSRVDEALALLIQGVESEPVSDNLRNLAHRLAALLSDEGTPSPRTGTPDNGATAD